MKLKFEANENSPEPMYKTSLPHSSWRRAFTAQLMGCGRGREEGWELITGDGTE